VTARPTPTVSPADFEVLTRRAGLTLTEAQRAGLFEVYGSFEAMLTRLRGASERVRGAEPAHIFVPGQS